MDHEEEVPAVIDFAAGAFCEGDGTEAMMQACLQRMAPCDRSSSGAAHEMTVGPPYLIKPGR